ncbi:MAG: GTP-binding protein [Candidatus Helarchaeota archaeon]|nr:GTP-binding protein [Candidatus Helarchaeota archaeon]
MKEKNSGQKLAKILIMGLENSGKTSIVLSLTRNTNLLSYCSLKPTVGINRVKFEEEESDTQFSIWDFGGQKQYRKDYLNDLDKHLIGIDKLIYVIDVQDGEKYDLTLQFLENIVNFLKKIEDSFEFLIFLHKFDPGLEKLDQYSDEMISSNLINKISKIIPSDFNYKIFKTTIYTVFHKVLVS